MYALVVQWIGRKLAELVMQVRFLPRARNENPKHPVLVDSPVIMLHVSRDPQDPQKRVFGVVVSFRQHTN